MLFAPWRVLAISVVNALLASLAAPQVCRVMSAEGVVAVVVPGGGLTTEGLPTPWVRRRLQEASALYQRLSQAGESCVIVLLSGGTPHKPMPTDPMSRFQVYEAEAGARALIREFGVPPAVVFEENWSLDTIGNAYMLRTVHTDVAGWRRLVVINNEFHMARTRAIFGKVFSLDPLPVGAPYQIEFVEVPNDGLEGQALAARREREARSTEGFLRNTASMQTLREMHSFLFSDHLAYASRRLLQDRDPVDPAILSSY